MSDYDCNVRVIPPVDIWDDNLGSSNVAEDEYPIYDSGTTYIKDDRVIVTTGVHKIYKSSTTQTGAYPPDNLASWIDEGNTNRFKMFDDGVASKTINADSIVVVITPDILFNALVLMEVAAKTVTVSCNSATSGLIYTKTIDMVDYTDITDWYQYFYNGFGRSSTLVLTDLPAYSDMTITVTIENTVGDAECGVFALGRQNVIGEELYGTKIGIIDYSVKTTNDEGVTSVTEGAFSKRADFSLAIENNKVDSTQRLLAANRAIPVIYAAGNKYNSNVILGYYKDFDITISTPAFAECSLSIEGLI